MLEYIRLNGFERNVLSKTKPLQYISSKNGLIIANNILNNIKGTVIMDRLIKTIEKGRKPIIIDRINQPIFPIGLLNNVFMYEIPAILKTIKADNPQYTIKAGTKTHCPNILYRRITKK
jgi:hypothetical protein